jgi:hypothetical protein
MGQIPMTLQLAAAIGRLQKPGYPLENRGQRIGHLTLPPWTARGIGGGFHGPHSAQVRPLSLLTREQGRVIFCLAEHPPPG